MFRTPVRGDPQPPRALAVVQRSHRLDDRVAAEGIGNPAQQSLGL
jgi:hypothetical protein